MKEREKEEIKLSLVVLIKERHRKSGTKRASHEDNLRISRELQMQI